jgi:hypothetical protein
MKNTLMFLLLFLASQEVLSQGRVHRFEEDQVFEMSWSADSELFLNGEQADIVVKTHDEDVMRCVFTRSSQHTDKALAKQELALMHLYQDQRKNSLSLRNYVQTKTGQKPKSVLKGSFTVYMPESANAGLVKIWNYFGTVEIKDLRCPVELKLEFSNLKMDAVASLSQVEMKYGEGLIYNCGGDADLTSDRTNIEVDHFHGNMKLTALYSEIEILHPEQVESLIIKAKKSELFLDIPSDAGPGYAITTINTETKALAGPELEGRIDEDRVKLSYKPRKTEGFAEIEMETGRLNYIVK